MTKKADTPRGLRYIGDGSALDNVPARDLSAEEAAHVDRAALIASGLYEDDNAPPAAAESEGSGQP